MVGDGIATLLDQHPEAFDCLVFKVVKGSEEQLASEDDPAGALESEARALSYESAVPARALIIYDDAVSFGTLPDGLRENFQAAEQPFKLLLWEGEIARSRCGSRFQIRPLPA